MGKCLGEVVVGSSGGSVGLSLSLLVSAAEPAVVLVLIGSARGWAVAGDKLGLVLDASK